MLRYDSTLNQFLFLFLFLLININSLEFESQINHNFISIDRIYQHMIYKNPINIFYS